MGHCTRNQSSYDGTHTYGDEARGTMKSCGTRRSAIIIGIAVAFAWSTSWVLIKVGLKDIPALTFAGLRYTLASICLLPALLLRPLRSGGWPQFRRHLPRLAALGVLLYAITQGAMFLALDYLPAVSVNLLWSFSSAVVALLGARWLGERPTVLQWVGIVICMAGAALFYLPAGFQVGQQVGLLACGIGVLANATAAILGRSINRSGEIEPVVVTLISMSIGAVLLLPIGIAVQGLPVISANNWLIIAWLAIVNTAAAFALWNRTLRVLSATESSVINGTMLVWIPLLAVIFLKENVGPKEIAALFLVGLGTLAVQVKRFRPSGRYKAAAAGPNCEARKDPHM